MLPSLRNLWPLMDGVRFATTYLQQPSHFAMATPLAKSQASALTLMRQYTLSVLRVGHRAPSVVRGDIVSA
jgi:hypothetical protein